MSSQFDQSPNDIGNCAKCTYSPDGISCDGMKCQQIATSLNIPLSRKRRSVDDDFASLAMDTSNRCDGCNADLMNIKVEIARELAKEEYMQRNNPTSSQSSQYLVPRVLNYLQFQHKSRTLTRIDFRIAGVSQRRIVSSDSMRNKMVFYSSQVSVSNNGTEKQEISTLAYSLTVMKTDVLTIAKTAGLSSNSTIDIPFVGSNVQIQFSNEKMVKKVLSQKFTIEAPMQKVILEPSTKLKIHFTFYQYEDLTNEFLDFAVDDSSTIIYPDFENDLTKGDSSCGGSCYTFQRNDTITAPLNKFLRENPDLINAIEYQDENSIHLLQTKDQLILKNFPTTEQIMNFGVDILYGPPEQM